MKRRGLKQQKRKRGKEEIRNKKIMSGWSTTQSGGREWKEKKNTFK